MDSRKKNPSTTFFVVFSGLRAMCTVGGPTSAVDLVITASRSHLQQNENFIGRSGGSRLRDSARADSDQF